jgi:hypothetical protein
VTRLPIALLICVLSATSLASQEAPEPIAPTADTTMISPRGAFVRSLVLPGWGQSYVGAPGRGAIYFAAEAGSLWMVYRSRQQLRAARVLERHLVDTGRLGEDERLDLVVSRERQQEDWITLSIFILLFSGADAYVAAQLADFDERFGVQPTPDGGVQMRATIPVGRRR